MRERFNITSIEQYLDIIMKIRVRLFGDAVPYFRHLLFRSSQMEAIYIWTLPSRAVQLMFSFNRKEAIEYVKDKDILEMVTELIRGPLSLITKRLAFSNSVSYGPFDHHLPQPSILAMDISLG